MKDEMDRKGVNVTYDELDGSASRWSATRGPAFAWLQR